MDPYQSYFAAPPAAQTASPIHVTFLGNTNILIDDGETRILTDGQFTRPGLMKSFFGAAPDKQAIAQELHSLNIVSVDALIPLHTHIDHAMDAPEVAFQTHAKIYGSASARRIVAGWVDFNSGSVEADEYRNLLGDDRFQSVSGGDTEKIGNFSVMFLDAGHVPVFGHKKAIKRPLKPPKGALSYKPSPVLALLIEHSGRRILIISSAGLVPKEAAEQWRNVRADVVLLSIAGLGRRDDNYVDTYFRQMLDGPGARKAVPIHWDDIFRPLERPLTPQSGVYGVLSHSKRSLEIACEKIAQQRPDVELVYLHYGERLALSELTSRANEGYGRCPD